MLVLLPALEPVLVRGFEQVLGLAPDKGNIADMVPWRHSVEVLFGVRSNCLPYFPWTPYLDLAYLPYDPLVVKEDWVEPMAILKDFGDKTAAEEKVETVPFAMAMVPLDLGRKLDRIQVEADNPIVVAVAVAHNVGDMADGICHREDPCRQNNQMEHAASDFCARLNNVDGIARARARPDVPDNFEVSFGLAGEQAVILVLERLYAIPANDRGVQVGRR